MPTEAERLFLANQGLAHFALKKVLRGPGVAATLRHCEHADLLQWSYLGLLRASRTFDPARGATFATYGVRCAMNAILRNAVRKKHWVGAALEGEPPAAEAVPGVDAELIGLALRRLNPPDREAVERVFGLSGHPRVTMTALAKEQGVTKERVRQRLERGKARLCRELRRMGLEPAQ